MSDLTTELEAVTHLNGMMSNVNILLNGSRDHSLHFNLNIVRINHVNSNL